MCIPKNVPGIGMGGGAKTSAAALKFDVLVTAQYSIRNRIAELFCMTLLAVDLATAMRSGPSLCNTSSDEDLQKNSTNRSSCQGFILP
jgi:hypothetical protein